MATSAIPIGALARRSGVPASALRFYEAQGLIKSTRSQAGRRTFARDVLRRVAFIRVAQSVGLSLEQIQGALATLPNQRTPTRADWGTVVERLAAGPGSAHRFIDEAARQTLLVYWLRLPVSTDVRALQSRRRCAITRDRSTLPSRRCAAACHKGGASEAWDLSAGQ